MSKRRHNFGTKRFKEKSLFIFHARIALKSLILLFVRLIARSARIGKTHTQTDRHTDRQNEYCNPRACAPRVNYTLPFFLFLKIISPCRNTNIATFFLLSLSLDLSGYRHSVRYRNAASTRYPQLPSWSTDSWPLSSDMAAHSLETAAPRSRALCPEQFLHSWTTFGKKKMGRGGTFYPFQLLRVMSL